MGNKIEDYCDDADCVHSGSDHALMVKHELSADDYDAIYERLLSANREYGTWAIDELQAQVKADIKAGVHD